MLEIMEIGLSPVSCLLYKKSFVDIDRFLTFWAISLNVSCILGHARPVVALPLHTSVETYLFVGASRAVNAF